MTTKELLTIARHKHACENCTFASPTCYIDCLDKRFEDDLIEYLEKQYNKEVNSCLKHRIIKSTRNASV